MHILRRAFIVVYSIMYVLCATHVYASPFPEFLKFSTEQYYFWEGRYKPALVLWLEPEEGFYLYDNTEISSGLPTKITIMDKDDAFKESVDILYPKGVKVQDLQDPSKQVSVYNKKIPIVIILPPNTVRDGLNIRTEGLLCAVGKCIPVRAIANIVVKNPEYLTDISKASWYPLFADEIAKIQYNFPNRKELMEIAQPKRPEALPPLAKKSFFDYEPRYPDMFRVHGKRKYILIAPDKIETVWRLGGKQDIVTLPDGTKADIVLRNSIRGILLPTGNNGETEFIEIELKKQARSKSGNFTLPTFKSGEFFTNKTIKDEGDKFVKDDILDTKLHFYKEQLAQEPTQPIISLNKPKIKEVPKKQAKPKPIPSEPDFLKPKLIPEEAFIEPTISRFYENFVRVPQNTRGLQEPESKITPQDIRTGKEIARLLEQDAEKAQNVIQRPRIQKPTNIAQIPTQKRSPYISEDDYLPAPENLRVYSQSVPRPSISLAPVERKSPQRTPQRVAPREQAVVRYLVDEGYLPKPEQVKDIVAIVPTNATQQQITRAIRQQENKGNPLQRTQVVREQRIARYILDEGYLPTPEELERYSIYLPNEITRKNVAQAVSDSFRSTTTRGTTTVRTNQVAQGSQLSRINRQKEERVARYLLEQGYVPQAVQVRDIVSILPSNPTNRQIADVLARQVAQGSSLQRTRTVREKQIARYVLEEGYLPTPEELERYALGLPEDITAREARALLREYLQGGVVRGVANVTAPQNTRISRLTTPKELQVSRFMVEEGYLPTPEQVRIYSQALPSNPTNRQIADVLARQVAQGSSLQRTRTVREKQIARYVLEEGYLPTPEELERYALGLPEDITAREARALLREYLQGGVVRGVANVTAPQNTRISRLTTPKELQVSRFMVEEGYLPTPEQVRIYSQALPSNPTNRQIADVLARQVAQGSSLQRTRTVREQQIARYVLEEGYLPTPEELERYALGLPEDITAREARALLREYLQGGVVRGVANVTAPQNTRISRLTTPKELQVSRFMVEEGYLPTPEQVRIYSQALPSNPTNRQIADVLARQVAQGSSLQRTRTVREQQIANYAIVDGYLLTPEELERYSLGLPEDLIAREARALLREYLRTGIVRDSANIIASQSVQGRQLARRITQKEQIIANYLVEEGYLPTPEQVRIYSQALPSNPTNRQIADVLARQVAQGSSLQRTRTVREQQIANYAIVDGYLLTPEELERYSLGLPEDLIAREARALLREYLRTGIVRDSANIIASQSVQGRQLARRITQKEQIIANYLVEEGYLPTPEQVRIYSQELPSNPTNRQISDVLAKQVAQGSSLQRTRTVREKQIARYMVEQGYLPTPEELARYALGLPEDMTALQLREVTKELLRSGIIRETADVATIQSSRGITLARTRFQNEKDIARYLLDEGYLPTPEQIRVYSKLISTNPNSAQIGIIIGEQVKNTPTLVRYTTEKEVIIARYLVEQGYLPTPEQVKELAQKVPTKATPQDINKIIATQVRQGSILVRTITEKEQQVAQYLSDQGYLPTPEQVRELAQSLPANPNAQELAQVVASQQSRGSQLVRYTVEKEQILARYLLDQGYLPTPEQVKELAQNLPTRPNAQELAQVVASQQSRGSQLVRYTVEKERILAQYLLDQGYLPTPEQVRELAQNLPTRPNAQELAQVVASQQSRGSQLVRYTVEKEQILARYLLDQGYLPTPEQVRELAQNLPANPNAQELAQVVASQQSRGSQLVRYTVEKERILAQYLLDQGYLPTPEQVRELAQNLPTRPNAQELAQVVASQQSRGSQLVRYTVEKERILAQYLLDQGYLPTPEQVRELAQNLPTRPNAQELAQVVASQQSRGSQLVRYTSEKEERIARYLIDQGYLATPEQIREIASELLSPKPTDKEIAQVVASQMNRGYLLVRYTSEKEQRIVQYLVTQGYLPTPEQIIEIGNSLPLNPTDKEIAQVVASQMNRGYLLVRYTSEKEERIARYLLDQGYLPTPKQIREIASELLSPKPTDKEIAQVVASQESRGYFLVRYTSEKELAIARYLIDQGYLPTPEQVREIGKGLPLNPTDKEIAQVVLNNAAVLRNLTPREEEYARFLTNQGYMPTSDELFEYTNKLLVRGVVKQEGFVPEGTAKVLRDLTPREVEIARYLIERGYLPTTEELAIYEARFPIGALNNEKIPMSLLDPIRNISIQEREIAMYLVDRGYLPTKEDLLLYETSYAIRMREKPEKIFDGRNLLLINYLEHERITRRKIIGFDYLLLPSNMYEHTWQSYLFRRYIEKQMIDHIFLVPPIDEKEYLYEYLLQQEDNRKSLTLLGPLYLSLLETYVVQERYAKALAMFILDPKYLYAQGDTARLRLREAWKIDLLEQMLSAYVLENSKRVNEGVFWNEEGTARVQSSFEGGLNFTPQVLQDAFGVSSLVKAMFFALLAGFILNFMPCVFPVITLKFSSIIAITKRLEEEEEERNASVMLANAEREAEELTKALYEEEVVEENSTTEVEDSEEYQSEETGYVSLLDDVQYDAILPVTHAEEKEETQVIDVVALFKRYNIFFCLGIVTFFAILGIFLHVTGSIWGRLFQMPSLVLVVACIVFALALSIFEVFHLPFISMRIKDDGTSAVQAFTTGMLTTLLATPCSAPLLGGVLAWLVTQSVDYYILVMLMVALGMSIPYILFIIFPKILYSLPKPGRWNVILSQVVGLFLIGTTIYLISLLPSGWLIHSLVTLFVVGIVLWALDIIPKYIHTKAMLYIARGIVILFSAGILYLVFLPSSQGVLWEPFNEEEFKRILGKEIIVMNFTAEWCPNCKILEQTVLTHKNVSAWKKEYEKKNIRFILADITHSSPFLENMMRLLQSNSIPLLAIFPAGENMNKPIVLRDLYTKANVETALERASKSK